MNESKPTPNFFVCTKILSITIIISSQKSALPAQRRERSRLRSSFLSFFLCASASGSAVVMSKSCKGMLEEMLECAEQSKCYSPENGRDLKFCVTALLSSSESDATTKHGLDECMTKKQLYLKCKRGQMDMRTRIRGNKGY